MARYVLMAQGESPRQADIDLIEGSNDITVIDRSGGAMLVEAPEDTVRELRERLSDWVVADEVTYPPPGPAIERVRDDDRKDPE